MISIRHGYNKLCTDNLKLNFKIGIHTNSNDVDKAFIICRDTLIQEFESECKNITTTFSAFSFLRTYSIISTKPKDCTANPKDIEKNIVAKRMCKNVFSELTKNNLVYSPINEIDDLLSDKLMCLIDSLFYLSQDQHSFYLNNNKGFQLDLFEDCCAFTLYDEGLALKQQEISKQVGPDYFQGSIGDECHIIDFMKATIEAFGNVASRFYNKVFNDNSPIFIDADKLSEPEFFKLLSQPLQRSNSPDRIIDLTELYKEFPNDCFLNGFLLRREDVSMLESYKHPQSAKRSRYRPILQLCIDGEQYCITTPYMVSEALSEHITNQLPFASLPCEWKQNKEISEFAKEWKNLHDKWLDDEVQKILELNKLVFLRNKKAIDGVNLEEEPSSVKCRNIGEIDFIVVDTKKQKISVIDTKFIKTKYNPASFGDDKSKFTQGKKPYEEQLFIKFEWIQNNLEHLQKELKREGITIYINKYAVDLFFITNAPTYYSFFSTYPIIPVNDLSRYLSK